MLRKALKGELRFLAALSQWVARVWLLLALGSFLGAGGSRGPVRGDKVCALGRSYVCAWVLVMSSVLLAVVSVLLSGV